MNPVLIGQIAGVLAVIQVVPYIVSILRGHTKPERMTYFIWFVVDALLIASYIAVGARTTIWVGVVYVFTGLTIFLLSLKHGMGGFSKLDIACLLLALAGIAVWLTTLAPAIAVPVLLGAVCPTIVAYFLLFPAAHHKMSKRRKASKIHTLLTHPVLLR